MALLVWWLVPFGGEAARIKDRLGELVELVEKERAETTIEAAGKSRKLADFFVDGAVVEYLPGRSFRAESDAMAGAFLQARGAVESISIWVIRHEVTLGDGEATAESTVKATAGVVERGGETRSETLTHRLDWRRTEEGWRIDGVEVAPEN